MSDVLTAIYQYFSSLPASTYYHFGEFLLLGGGSMITIQLLKYWKALKGRNHILRFLNGAFATIIAGVQALHSSGINLAAFGKQAAALAVVTNALYRFFNSALFKRFEQLEAKAVAYDHLAPAPATPVAQEAPTEFTL